MIPNAPNLKNAEESKVDNITRAAYYCFVLLVDHFTMRTCSTISSLKKRNLCPNAHGGWSSLCLPTCAFCKCLIQDISALLFHQKVSPCQTEYRAWGGENDSLSDVKDYFHLRVWWREWCKCPSCYTSHMSKNLTVWRSLSILNSTELMQFLRHSHSRPEWCHQFVFSRTHGIQTNL